MPLAQSSPYIAVKQKYNWSPLNYLVQWILRAKPRSFYNPNTSLQRKRYTDRCFRGERGPRVHWGNTRYMSCIYTKRPCLYNRFKNETVEFIDCGQCWWGIYRAAFHLEWNLSLPHSCAMKCTTLTACEGSALGSVIPEPSNYVIGTSRAFCAQPWRCCYHRTWSWGAFQHCYKLYNKMHNLHGPWRLGNWFRDPGTK